MTNVGLRANWQQMSDDELRQKIELIESRAGDYRLCTDALHRYFSKLNSAKLYVLRGELARREDARRIAKRLRRRSR